MQDPDFLPEPHWWQQLSGWFYKVMHKIESKNKTINDQHIPSVLFSYWAGRKLVTLDRDKNQTAYHYACVQIRNVKAHGKDYFFLCTWRRCSKTICIIPTLQSACLICYLLQLQVGHKWINNQRQLLSALYCACPMVLSSCRHDNVPLTTSHS